MWGSQLRDATPAAGDKMSVSFAARLRPRNSPSTRLRLAGLERLKHRWRAVDFRPADLAAKAGNT
jgi:hypothetical protein